MATGKAVGEFSFKFTTITNTPGPAGSVLSQVNYEGTVTGFGAVFTTVTYVGGPKGGTFSDVGTAFLREWRRPQRHRSGELRVHRETPLEDDRLCADLRWPQAR